MLVAWQGSRDFRSLQSVNFVFCFVYKFWGVLGSVTYRQNNRCLTLSEDVVQEVIYFPNLISGAEHACDVTLLGIRSYSEWSDVRSCDQTDILSQLVFCMRGVPHAEGGAEAGMHPVKYGVPSLDRNFFEPLPAPPRCPRFLCMFCAREVIYFPNLISGAEHACDVALLGIRSQC